MMPMVKKESESLPTSNGVEKKNNPYFIRVSEL